MLSMDKRTEGWTDKQTDGQKTVGQTDELAQNTFQTIPNILFFGINVILETFSVLFPKAAF